MREEGERQQVEEQRRVDAEKQELEEAERQKKGTRRCGKAETSGKTIVPVQPTPMEIVTPPPKIIVPAHRTPREIITNSLGMKLAWIPRGKFWMGGGGGKPANKQVEIPHDFYIGIYPVTQAEWVDIKGSNPSYFSRSGGGAAQVKSISDADLPAPLPGRTGVLG